VEEHTYLDLVEAMLETGPVKSTRLNELATLLGPELYTEASIMIGWWAGTVPLLVKSFDL
jgi:hypothetical protein